jgi:hypothetical protein
MPGIVKILLALIIAVPLVGLGAAYCAAGLGQQRIAGYEASAIGSLRAIISAQMTYAAECDGVYAPALERLASRGLLSPSLGSDPAVHQGYRFTLDRSSGSQALSATSPSCDGSITGFIVRAVPIDPGTTGVRFFSADDSGDITQSTSAAFNDAAPLGMGTR